MGIRRDIRLHQLARASRRRALIAGALAALAAVVPASGEPGLAACLREHVVCVRGGALTKAETAALEKEIARSGAAPVFIAVVPASRAPATARLATLHERLGRPGTYAILAGQSLRAAATKGFPHVVPLAEAASEAHNGEGARAVLADFIRRVAEARQGGGAPPPGGFARPQRQTDDGGGGPGAELIVALAAAAAAFWLWRHSARNR